MVNRQGSDASPWTTFWNSLDAFRRPAGMLGRGAKIPESAEDPPTPGSNAPPGDGKVPDPVGKAPGSAPRLTDFNAVRARRMTAAKREAWQKLWYVEGLSTVAEGELAPYGTWQELLTFAASLDETDARLGNLLRRVVLAGETVAEVATAMGSTPRRIRRELAWLDARVSKGVHGLGRDGKPVTIFSLPVLPDLSQGEVSLELERYRRTCNARCIDQARAPGFERDILAYLAETHPYLSRLVTLCCREKRSLSEARREIGLSAESTTALWRLGRYLAFREFGIWLRLTRDPPDEESCDFTPRPRRPLDSDAAKW